MYHVKVRVREGTKVYNVALCDVETLEELKKYLPSIDRADWKVKTGQVRVFSGRKRLSCNSVRILMGWKLRQMYDREGNPK